MMENTQEWPQIGAFSYKFVSLETLIASFQKQGLTAVQLGGPLLDQVLDKPEQALQMRQTLENNGLQIVALAGYRNIVAVDPVVRTANLTFLKQCLRIAPYLGKPIVATETGTLNRDNEWASAPENATQAAWETLCRSIDELVQVAEEAGSILALEGYVNNIVTTVDQMSKLLEYSSSSHLQVVLDPYNYLSADLLDRQEEITRDFLNRFQTHFVVAHLKDVARQGAEIDTPEFGTGIFQQQLYIEFLREQRPDLPLIFEHLSWEHLPIVIQRLQKLIHTNA